MNYQVCIVDDESGIGKMCEDYLADSYAVKVFNSPQEAVDAFEHDYRPDVLLTDIKMPGMNGFEMARKIHGVDPKLPVVLMSGYAEKKHVIEAMDTEAYGFIEKPFSPKKMKSTLDLAIRKTHHLQLLESLNKKYQDLTVALMELNAKYVERYAEAENKLIAANPSHKPSPKEAAEYLTSVQAQNRLNSAIDKMYKEIQALKEADKANEPHAF